MQKITNNPQEAETKTRCFFSLKRWPKWWKLVLGLGFVLVLVHIFAICDQTSKNSLMTNEIKVWPFSYVSPYFYDAPHADVLIEPEMVVDYASLIFRYSSYGKNHPNECVQGIYLDSEKGVWQVFFDDPNKSSGLGGGYLIFLSRETGEVLESGPSE